MEAIAATIGTGSAPASCACWSSCRASCSRPAIAASATAKAVDSTRPAVSAWTSASGDLRSLLTGVRGGVLDELATDRGELGEVGAEGVHERDQRLGLDATLGARELGGHEGLLVPGALDGARIDPRHTGLLERVQKLLAAVAAAVDEHQGDVLLRGPEVVQQLRGSPCRGPTAAQGPPRSAARRTVRGWPPGPALRARRRPRRGRGPPPWDRPRGRGRAGAGRRGRRSGSRCRGPARSGRGRTLCHSTSLTGAPHCGADWMILSGPGRRCAARRCRQRAAPRCRARRCAARGPRRSAADPAPRRWGGRSRCPVPPTPGRDRALACRYSGACWNREP